MSRSADVTIGVDVGGTKTSAGLVTSGGSVVARSSRATPSRSPHEVEDAIVDLVNELRARPEAASGVLAIGVGAAGWVDADRTTVRFAPHLAWRNEPVRDRLAARTGLPVSIDNDAFAAAWAEHRFGLGRTSAVMVCLTLGTGIGGAAVIEGRLMRGAYGMAGEWGHMAVVPEGHWCPCGNRGCWEQYASGNALVRDARALVEARSPQAHRLRNDCADDPSRLTGMMITAAATDGDQTATELIADVGQWLGRGIANLAAALDPELFVIGGGLCEAGELLLRPARAAYERSLPGRGFRELARIETASLGNAAGLVGAADLARRARACPGERNQPLGKCGPPGKG